MLIAILVSTNTFAQIKVKKMFKDQPIFGYIDTEHTLEINHTRALVGSPPLIRDSHLDSLALVRCLRYSKLIFSDVSYVDNPKFIKKEIHKDFIGFFKSENSTNCIIGAGFNEKQFSILTPSMVYSKIISTNFIPGKAYNNSVGHFQNRINRNWRKFGSATVVIFIKIKNADYKPKEISLEFESKAIFLNYEVFD